MRSLRDVEVEEAMYHGIQSTPSFCRFSGSSTNLCLPPQESDFPHTGGRHASFKEGTISTD